MTTSTTAAAKPRYCLVNVVNAAMEAIGKGRDRILVVRRQAPKVTRRSQMIADRMPVIMWNGARSPLWSPVLFLPKSRRSITTARWPN
jgi:hypothetical protein